MKKTASAEWKGSLRDGSGTISTQTGVLDHAPYGFRARFEDGPGTNPEELLGAAHAGCYSMALSNLLGQENLTADYIRTSAEITLDRTDSGFVISASHLTVVARVPGASAETFARLAHQAETGCPVSKVLNARISLDARLES
jgi:osmotically inducible protein OsmC